MSKIEKQLNGKYAITTDNTNLSIGVGSIHSTKWENRCYLNIAAKNVNQDVASDKIKTINNKQCVEYEVFRTHKNGKNKSEVHRIYEPQSPTEWDIEWQSLSDVPQDGIVEFDVSQPAGLDWYYQAALTQAELDLGMYRPDNVIGSYAVYWKDSGRILKANGIEKVNYETGKYCHIYRPVCIDKNGNREWGIMSYVAGILTILLPMDWVRNARFPIILDPTFGYTSIGVSNGQASTDQLDASGPFTPASAGKMVSISAYIAEKSSDTRCTFGLYADSSGAPAARVVDTAEVNPGSLGWHTSNTDAAAAITATAYWLALHCGGYDVLIRFDSGAPASGKYIKYRTGVTYVAGSTPDPFGTPDSLPNYCRSYYATYTEATETKHRPFFSFRPGLPAD